MKKIAILGSTGSIGKSTLDVIRKFKDRFKVEILTANSSVDTLIEQAMEFKPSLVVLKNKKSAELLKKELKGKCEVISGDEGLITAAADYDYDIFVGAMVGFCGLAPTLEAIKRKKRIALANKETLVVAGEIVSNLIKEKKAELIPVDSEHSAIYQCLLGEKTSEVEKLILTASGGPFLNKDKREFNRVTINEALCHPNWKMGNKITIDSATMMNKGLEVIEAHWLFDIPQKKIEVIIHPQSIIHSMVQFVDGSIKAQLSLPDMKLPIQFALTAPYRLPGSFVQTDLSQIGNLTFYKPDLNKFECLKLAYDVMKEGGTAPCVLNASNEVAVAKFLKGKIKFSRIPEIINESLNYIPNHQKPDLENIIECDRKTREFAEKLS
jgi:1-deoxy-D-xylulose-5-phosphate reductoisomerase